MLSYLALSLLPAIVAATPFTSSSSSTTFQQEFDNNKKTVESGGNTVMIIGIVIAVIVLILFIVYLSFCLGLCCFVGRKGPKFAKKVAHSRPGFNNTSGYPTGPANPNAPGGVAQPSGPQHFNFDHPS
jgi:uncharacterized membrane protein